MPDSIDLAYRSRVDAIKSEVARQLGAMYGESVDPVDLAGSIGAFLELAEPLIAAGQATAAQLAADYLRSKAARRGIALELDDDDEIPGTTRTGDALVVGMAAIPSMVLGQIRDGVEEGDAVDFGRYLVERFGDSEIAGAVDRQVDEATQAATVVGWEGIVDADACDLCQANAGDHPLTDELYRHPNCNCERVPIFAGPGGERLTDDEAIAEQMARDIREASEGAEYGVTGILRGIEDDTDGRLAGLASRLKGEDRIVEKILADVDEGKGRVELIEINDGLRYTLEYGEDDYAQGYADALEALEAAGVEEIRVKNFWGEPGYQGINGVFETPDGVRFELQFHTPKSLALKKPSHLLFEELRTSTDPEERLRLDAEITALWKDLQESDHAATFGGLSSDTVAAAAAAAELVDAPIAASPSTFVSAFEQAFPADSPYTAYVTHYSAADIIAGAMVPLTTNDGQTGVIVHDHGDGRVEATALFNVSAVPGAGLKILGQAIADYGVNYVECFGPKLNQLYETLGFRDTDVFPFDLEQAPPTWNMALNDSPDYHLMRLAT